MNCLKVPIKITAQNKVKHTCNSTLTPSWLEIL
jgi:hypothetical protein